MQTKLCRCCRLTLKRLWRHYFPKIKRKIELTKLSLSFQDPFFKTRQHVDGPSFGSYCVLGFYMPFKLRHVHSCELLFSAVYQGFENDWKDIS